jgi:signal transduction histidine kinase
MVESHPFWLSPEKYREAYEKQGLHMMTLMLDYTTSISALRRDLFMRFGMSLIALAAMAGFALAWSGMTRSSELRVRLAQARATNDSLRELNLAAAGLAHETRNPLNLVRGVAQMIVRDESVSETARDHLATVVQEVDRVTATLNEFIDYSKPREPRFAVVDPLEVGRHVARTLESDLEAKGITFTCEGHPVSVRADATMLRQCLFNLILNATQAVDAGGHISFRVERDQQGVRIGVIDDGPGVPPEAREDIFRPYFTLNERGSGLGLAVVRQVAAAHGWAIRYLPQEPRGSEFRISGIREAAEGET